MKLYRFASPGPVVWHLSKTIVLVGAFWAALIVLPAYLLALGVHEADLQIFIFPPLPEVGYVVGAASFLTGLWAMFTVAIRGHGTPLPFNAARRLVIGGPYSWMRNPLVMAGMGQGAAATFYTGVVPIFPFVVIELLICQMIITSLEKPELERAFGRDFEAYRRHVRYWLPMRRRWLPERRDGRPVSLDEIEMAPKRRRG